MKKLLLIITSCLVFFSCASTGLNLKNRGFAYEKVNVSVESVYVHLGSFVDGTMRYTSKVPGTDFTQVLVKIRNETAEAAPGLVGNQFELIAQDSHKKYIPGEFVSLISDYSKNTFGDRIAPHTERVLSLVFLCPKDAQPLGLMVNRSDSFPFVTNSDPSADPGYQAFVDQLKADETAVNLATRLSYPVVKAFLDANHVDKNAKGRLGLSLLQVAAIGGNTSVVEGLIKDGADTSVTASSFNDELQLVHLIVQSGNPVLVRVGQDLGLDYRKATKNGESCFSLAMKSNSVPVVKELVILGIDPTKEVIKFAWNSREAVNYALLSSTPEMKEYFLSLGYKLPEKKN